MHSINNNPSITENNHQLIINLEKRSKRTESDQLSSKQQSEAENKLEMIAANGKMKTKIKMYKI